MDPRLTADVLAVCDTLGVSDGPTYLRDPQCLGSTKDLVLFLRRDTKEHEVRRLLGESQIVQRDLMPIFKMDDCSEDLSEVVLRLLVNLTSPPLELYPEGLPRDKQGQNHVIIMTRHLQAYKTAFVDENFWAVIGSKLGKLIENMEIILENQKNTVERILILIRNVLQVPADPSEEMRNDDDASVHDQILWVMQKAGVMDLVLFIASSDSTREFCMHIVEMLTLIFREHSGQQLAKTTLERNQTEIREDEKELAQTLKCESLKRSRKQVTHRSFGGTYVVRGLQASSGQDQICHKPVQSVAELSLDSLKKVKKTAVNRREVVEDKTTRRSTLSMRLLLKEFCTEFLSGAYNYLMRIVKDRLTRERGQENDEIYYLGAMRFFMEFNRYADTKFTVARVSETMSIVTFHYVQGLISNYHDLMVTDKEARSLWSKRAHTAFRAYQELLSTLFIMDKTKETEEAARIIQSSIFYLPEYRELCVGLLASYEGQKLSRNYLCDLVETNHIFLKMLQEFTKEKKILVRGKKRGRRQKKKAKNKTKKRVKTNTERDWEELEGELESFLASSWEPLEMIPFDDVSETPVDEQRGTAMSRIATYIGKKDFNEATSLLRAAREVWPDDHQLSKETEISSLKSIFLGASPLPQEDEGDASEEADDENEDEIEDDEEYEEFEQSEPSNESEFDFRGFMERYTNVKIVANYGNLFRNYATLSENVLYCIVKMFHRLVFDLDYSALLCQASIFRTFQSLLKMAPLRPELKVATEFFNHFWPRFVKLATRNPKMFVEILFWKTGREASEIQNGYTPYEATEAAARTKKRKNVRGTLNEEEENEISVLAAEYATLPKEKGRKQVDWINERLINGPKVKKVLESFLKEKGLMVPATRKSQKGSNGFGPANQGQGFENGNGTPLESDGNHLETSMPNWSGSESDVSFSNMPTARLGTRPASDSESDGETSAAENVEELTVNSTVEKEKSVERMEVHGTVSGSRKRKVVIASDSEKEENGKEEEGAPTSSNAVASKSHIISSSSEDDGSATEKDGVDKKKRRKVRAILSDSD